MKHSMIAAAALVVLVASSGLQAQDGSWVETRFHRVHLLNGNFIDGHLIGESDRTTTSAGSTTSRMIGVMSDIFAVAAFCSSGFTSQRLVKHAITCGSPFLLTT